MQPLEDDTSIECEGASAAGAAAVVQHVEPSMFEEVGPREELREQMAEAVDDAGLESFAEKAFTRRCASCTDAIPPP